MTQLPATFIEAEALAFARAEFAFFRDHKVPFLDLDLHWFDKADNRMLARHQMKMLAMLNAHNMMTVRDYAHAGWDIADEALRELIIEHLDRGQLLPTALASYNMDITRGGPRHLPAQKKSDNFLRDIVIVTTIKRVVEKFAKSDLKPTRNPASSRQSACSIVARALREEGLTPTKETAVVAIWTKYSPLLPRANSNT